MRFDMGFQIVHDYPMMGEDYEFDIVLENG